MSQAQIKEGLIFQIIHLLDTQKEFIFTYGDVLVDSIASVGGPIKTCIGLWDGSQLQIETSIATYEDVYVLEEMLAWLTMRNEEKMIETIVNQLCHDLKERVHAISVVYKTPTFTKFLSNFSDSPKSTGALLKEDEDDIERNLAALFDFLNGNLEVLTNHLEEKFSLKVVKGVWDQFLRTSEALIVPSLGDDAKDRKPWDEKRLQFFAKYIESAQEFFNAGEGEGLSMEQIQGQPFIQLKLILVNYHSTKQELMQIYQELVLQVRLDSHDEVKKKVHGEMSHLELDWILKLLKMRGNGDFVSSELKKRCEGRWRS